MKNCNKYGSTFRQNTKILNTVRFMKELLATKRGSVKSGRINQSLKHTVPDPRSQTVRFETCRTIIDELLMKTLGICGFYFQVTPQLCIHWRCVRYNDQLLMKTLGICGFYFQVTPQLCIHWRCVRYNDQLLMKTLGICGFYFQVTPQLCIHWRCVRYNDQLLMKH